MNDVQRDRVRSGKGFIAALDQSGGSTPKALAAYGVPKSAYASASEMFTLVHEMRVRIATSPAFDARVIGTILFEDTMRRQLGGVPSARYLWEEKQIVPFVKIDRGLAERGNDVQLLAPIQSPSELLRELRSYGVFGTKERSVIHEANAAGISAVVDQQFELGEAVLSAGLVPIIEPEVSIVSTTKSEAEELLRDALLVALDQASASVIVKLTLPEVADIYEPLVHHEKVLRVVALSGGYSLTESTHRLAANHGVIASFSRALTNGLRIDLTEAEFNAQFDGAIAEIASASAT